MSNLKLISEEIERAALKSLHDHCPPDCKERLGLKLIDADDAMVAVSKNDPSILINRTVGLGTRQPVEKQTVETILSVYKDHEVDTFFLHLYEEDLKFDRADIQNKFGLRKARGWMKFQRDASPPAPASSNLHIEHVSTDRSTDFAKIVCPAFGMTDSAIPMLAALASDPRWYLYVSYEGQTPAGAGALFVDGKSAWLEWGATDTSFRRRGSQAVIMEARIQKAIELGCENIFTETGEEVEGDPQHSYKNILKAGFKESQIRSNYTLA
ncbi:hypothetical protein ACFL17_07950 [Pseudomonadota bacterium]